MGRVHFERGGRGGMVRDSFVKPGERLIFVTEANARGNQSERIDRTVLPRPRLLQREPSLNGPSRPAVGVSLHRPRPINSAFELPPSLGIRKGLGKLSFLYVGKSKHVHPRKIRLYLKELREIGPGRNRIGGQNKGKRRCPSQ